MTSILCIEGGSAGRKISIVNESVCFGNKLCAFQSYGINPFYLYYYLQNPIFLDVFNTKTTGIIGGVSVNVIKSLLFAVPPLAEQARIVAAIERYGPLIAEYDKLETEATALDNTIKDKLKKSILQYAIQGKLVPQDENDEPASVLLERIRAEKKAQLGKKYVDSYIYKGDDNCYYEKVGEVVKNITEEIPFEIPKNWKWARLGSIASYIHRGKSPVYGLDKTLPIIAQKCNQWSGIKTEKCLFAEKTLVCKYTEEQYLKTGDIIINSTGTGTVGRTGIITKNIFEKYREFVADSHITVLRIYSEISSKYVLAYLTSPEIQVGLEKRCSGSTNQIELATNTINEYLLPLPPLQEQRRIVDTICKLKEKMG